MDSTAVQITQAQKQQYRDEGYFILEPVIPDEHLQMLREECHYFLELTEAEMDRAGQDVLGISHRHKRYFISRRYQERPRLSAFIFSDLTFPLAPRP